MAKTGIKPAVTEPVDVAAWREQALAAQLPASLIDWLAMHDADADQWQDAIGSWKTHGCWQTPDGSSRWGEKKA